MSVARISEVTASSATSFTAAIDEAIQRANQTLKNVKGAWIKDQELVIDDGRITEYRVRMQITFVLTD